MKAVIDLAGQLTEGLRELHLHAIGESYAEEAEKARREMSSCEQYLLKLVQRECGTRLENRVARVLRESQLPIEKT